MRIKGLFWILTALLLSVLAIITYHAFYTESVSLFFLVGRTRTSDSSLFVCVLSPYHQAASYHWERYGAVEGTGISVPV